MGEPAFPPVLGVLDLEASPYLRDGIPDLVASDVYGDDARIVFGLADGRLCELPVATVHRWATEAAGWRRLTDTIIPVDTFAQAYAAITGFPAGGGYSNQPVGAPAALLEGLRRACDGTAPELHIRSDEDPTYGFSVSGRQGWVIVSTFGGQIVGRFTVLVSGTWAASPELFRWAATHTSIPTYGSVSLWLDETTDEVQFRVGYRILLGLLTAGGVADLVEGMANDAANAEASLSRVQ